MDISELRRIAYNCALDYRAMSRLVCSEAFERAWDLMSDAFRNEVLQQIMGGAPSNVRRLMRKALTDSLQDMPMRQLREVAKQQGIDYYHHKTKERLLYELRGSAKEQVDDAPDTCVGGGDASDADAGRHLSP